MGAWGRKEGDRRSVHGAGSLPSPLCPGQGRLTLLVAVDADNLTEGHNKGVVPVNAGKEPVWCRCVPRPAIPPSSSPGPNTRETTLNSSIQGTTISTLTVAENVTSASHLVPLGPTLSSWHRAWQSQLPRAWLRQTSPCPGPAQS